jgi:hypothetical protein
MKVRHREYDSKLLTQLQQQTEKGHGIRATGNGRSNALSRTEQALFVNSF